MSEVIPGDEDRGGDGAIEPDPEPGTGDEPETDDGQGGEGTDDGGPGSLNM